MKARTLIKRIVAGLLVLLGIVVIVWAANLATLGPRTASAATEALTESREQARQNHADLIAAASRDLGVDPAHSASGYRCSVVGYDRGWFTYRYGQECFWVSVDYYQVSDSEAESLISRFSNSGARPEQCPSLFLTLREDERFGTVQSRLLPADRPAEIRCRVPTLETQQMRVRYSDATELVVEQAVAADVVDDGSVWVAVPREEPFFQRDLGCGVRIIFCSRPMSAPAMPRD